MSSKETSPRVVTFICDRCGATEKVQGHGVPGSWRRISLAFLDAPSEGGLYVASTAWGREKPAVSHELCDRCAAHVLDALKHPAPQPGASGREA